MEKTFVDTNIFVYAIFDVDEKKRNSCESLFQNAGAGKVKLWTTEWVVAELVWLLMRKKRNWNEVKSIILERIIPTNGLTIQNKNKLEEAIAKSKKQTDFIDFLNLATVEDKKIKRGYSYDGGLDSWKNFKRLEP